MIVDAILRLFLDFINWVVDLIPTIQNFAILQSLGGFADLIAASNYFLPVGTMALCLVAIIAVHVIMQNVWVINWVVKRIRGG